MIREQAHAKINVFLQVTGKRDDGYHTLESVMVPLALHDTVELVATEAEGVRLFCEHPPTADPEDNIVVQVAKAMQARFGFCGVDIHLTKHIPIAAGLGGGSADAAATLRGLNRLFQLSLKPEELAEMGLKFGADIPFCVHERAAMAQGIGEQLTFLPEISPLPVWLGTPALTLSTADVFARVTPDDFQHRSLAKIIEAWTLGEGARLNALCTNSLTVAAEKTSPAFRTFMQRFALHGAQSFTMSGSGPTVFVIGPDALTLDRTDLADATFRFSILTKTL
ncbi:MAG: 4-(cytidine 5'-diphospho)-2-C-methyl-D-erythritol kinase [Acholeplasmatales bacterium]|nr:MAG: 4-(cytidine 5'-diphospho)-2-C-methyl-D-erythritol kinase [Acholeplasmatales bacterium]